MNVVMFPIKDIRNYDANPRLISDAAVTKLASLIQEFGWTQPIVLDSEHVVVAGHTRLAAAIRLGRTHVPVHFAAELSPEQVRAYRIADNRLHECSTWDPQLLKFERAE